MKKLIIIFIFLFLFTLSSFSQPSGFTEFWEGRGDSYLYKYSNLWANELYGDGSNITILDSDGNFSQNDLEYINDFLFDRLGEIDISDSSGESEGTLIVVGKDVINKGDNSYTFLLPDTTKYEGKKFREGTPWVKYGQGVELTTEHFNLLTGDTMLSHKGIKIIIANDGIFQDDYDLLLIGFLEDVSSTESKNYDTGTGIVSNIDNTFNTFAKSKILE